MAPRGQVLPNAATESAREARKTFFCELCQKGYARSNDFEAHEGSYDHQHRKRLKDMKQLVKDPSAAAKAKAAEQRANQEAGISSISVSLNPGGNSSSQTKKKPVFRSTLQPQAAAAIAPQKPVSSSIPAAVLGLELNPRDPKSANEENDPSGAVRNGWWEDRYDPRFVTGCDESCPACRGGAAGTEICL